MTTPYARHRNAIAPKKTAKITTPSQKALLKARKRVQLYPMDTTSWRALGALLIEDHPDEALESLIHASALTPDDFLTLELLAQAQTALGNENEAMEYIERALTLNPDFSRGHFRIASMLYQRIQYEQALTHIDIANTLTPENSAILSCKGNILYRLFRFDEALAIFKKLVQQHPKNYIFWNSVGNVQRDMGQFEEADKHYQRSIDLAKDDAVPFSNRLTTLHYRSDMNRDDIFQVCKEWQARFAPTRRNDRPTPTDLSIDRTIRIGMFSDGFRAHPVGWMGTAALENLQKHEIELYSYSTNQAVDHLSQRIKMASTKWTSIQHMSDEAFAQLIREDQIDILIDLCGHNAGNRMQAMVMEPAPILLKWVGGLINTTGVDAIDYLLTDAVETPEGDDAFYTEKLIRMPDDYICFTPPPYVPSVTALPALQNDYITLGCFNNPTKINDTLLTEWASLMRALSDSRLFLKGHQFANEQVCQHIRVHMAEQGIVGERLIFEGQSKHQDLLETYNRIDIALDSWPYSGGLTTCEAMLMGVPVVTLPGPTFAGRHSATHLINAGMPELVVNSWDEYRQRVIELANDLNSLSTIRTHLRSILLQSPVCDGPRFAKHFTTAMRAIWQRYCEGKAPAALSISEESEAWFEGEDQPMDIQHPVIEPEQDENDFSFSFKGKVVAVDNGASLVKYDMLTKLSNLGAFSTIIFDHASIISDTAILQQQGDVHYFPHAVLGDGQPATLYACLSPADSTTLQPLSEPQLAIEDQTATQVLTTLPIVSHRLDAIEGLENIDWLLLDNLNDSLAVLEHGQEALTNTLLIQTRINFASTHDRQPELAAISGWLSQHGFSFYRFNNLQHHSHLPKRDDIAAQQGTQLTAADALFIPNKQRMAELTENQRLKLAFVLHSVYGIKDLTYAIVNSISSRIGDAYLTAIASKPVREELELQTKQPSQNAPLSQSAKSNIKPQNIIATLQGANIIRAGRSVHTYSDVCVGVPIYNEEKYIAQTLDSLKAQNVDNVHFLVTDNSSTDRTLELCQEIIGSDERFTIVQQPKNLGALENFQYAFDASQSKFFMWLSGHDFVSEYYLETAAKKLEKTPSLSMICGQPYAVLNDKLVGLVKDAVYDFTHENPLIRYLQSVAQVANCTILQSLFRRKDLKRYVFKKTISFDHVLISHLLWHGKLSYMETEKYYRRYFEQRTSTQPERITGDKRPLSRDEFYSYYLDDFSRVYQGKQGEKNQLKGKILEMLKQRFDNV
ncbi:glycosyltransferase [Alcaligenaceae bacterium]|nr:glycosyltransferase [Alcaligenaceae bacterium]